MRMRIFSNMSQIPSVFESITYIPGGDKPPQPKFTGPIQDNGALINIRWKRISSTHAVQLGKDDVPIPGLEPFEFAPDKKVMGFGPNDSESQSEMIAALDMQDHVLDRCNMGHAFYFERGKPSPCPFCSATRAEKFEQRCNALTEELTQSARKLAESEERVGALSMQLKNRPPEDPKPAPKKGKDEPKRSASDETVEKSATESDVAVKRSADSAKDATEPVAPQKGKAKDDSPLL